MCGIFGYVSKKLSTDTVFSADARQRAASVLEFMRLRGPDGRGIKEGPGWLFGHVRLAILDPSSGKQPWSDCASGAVITFNGEIFNFRNIREELISKGYRFISKCDTEVLLAAYLEWGENCLERLNGFFSFAIFDPRRNIIFAARDRAGVKPFFYQAENDSFAFCSSVAGLLKFSGGVPRPDLPAVSNYLMSGRNVFGDKTMLEGIKLLRPGHCMIVNISDVSFKVRRYWSRPVMKPDEKARPDFKTASASVKSLVEEAVAMRLISDVPLGAFLSGGIDSAVICTEAAKHSSFKLPLFCAGTDDESTNEFQYARLVAEKLGTELREVIVDASCFSEYWDFLMRQKGLPLCTSNEISIYKLSEALRRECTVTLTGEGSDEIFGGYVAQHFAGYDFDRCARTSEAADNYSKLGMAMIMLCGRSFFINDTDHYTSTCAWLGYPERARLFSPDAWKTLSDDDELFSFYEDFFDSVSTCSTFDKRMHIHAEFNLENLLSRIDNSSMSASVEARVPFTDYRLIEMLFKMPDDYKIDWVSDEARKRGHDLSAKDIDKLGLLESKRLLRNAYKDELPASIIQRRKMSFPVPFKKWFYGPLFAEIKDICVNSSFSREFLSAKEINALLERSDEALWLLANLCRWYEGLRKI